jgi:BirA family biotin operon repressor/biotin-[acetyl-CoA-carboxylase] ligase
MRSDPTWKPANTGDLTYERVLEAARPWGLEVRYCAETGSTNAEAAAWAPLLGAGGAPGAGGAASWSAPGGGLVVANHQTAGRGRLDRTWFSTPGTCLLFSLVVHPAVDPSLLGLVPLAAGVAACRAARSEGIDARLKWPNDLIAGGRKAGGILCETAWRAGAAGGAGPAGSAGWLVVGVGLNVNLETDDLPAELRGTATSLSAEAGRPLDRSGLLSSFLAAFLPLLGTLETSGGSAVLDAYRPLCDTVGAEVRADVSGLAVTGVATDIDASGALVLDTGALLRSGDVVHLTRESTGTLL